MIEDENGFKKELAEEALFDMDERTYAMLKAMDKTDEMIVMEIGRDEHGQYLTGIDDPEKVQMILDAYEVTLKENPAEK